MEGFKAFNKGLKCKGFQYKEGETYETEEAFICQKGFHFCENPLDVLNYYDLCDSEFAKVEALGKIDKQEGDSKCATTKIKIGAKLSLGLFVKASVDFLLNVCKPGEKIQAASGDSSKLAASGDYSKLAASGDYSQLAASGHYSKLAASGYSSKLAASGYSSQLALNGSDSVGAGIGINNRIKGKKGCWITLAEWECDRKKNRYTPTCVKSAQIDGKVLKADTWYKLENGEFIEVK